MSLTYRRNSRGPSTVPWGTPDSTGIHYDWAPFSTTRWLRSERNDEIHALVLPRIPGWSSFNSNQRCGTESKAFEKSKIAMTVRKPLSKIWPNHWLQETAVSHMNALTKNRVDVEWEFGYRPGSCWCWNTQCARMFSLIDAFARDEFTVAFLRACDEFTMWRLHPVTSSLVTDELSSKLLSLWSKRQKVKTATGQNAERNGYSQNIDKPKQHPQF